MATDRMADTLAGAFVSSDQTSLSLPVKIKQEPVEADPEPVMTSVQSPPASWEHHRVRTYTRMKHVASPDTSVCEVCQGEFVHPTMLLLHKLCHFNTNHVCYVCDSFFIHTDTLILHMATIHRNLSVSAQNYKGETERAFVCSRCLQRFSSNKMLTKHQKLHTLRDDSTYSCKICALDFIGNRALTAHLNSPRHKEMKAKLQGIFICVDCRAIFPTRDSYAMHMMMRAQSETCDKITDDDDMAPMATHSGEVSTMNMHSPAVSIANMPDLMQANDAQLNLGIVTSANSFNLANPLQACTPMYITPRSFAEQTGEAIVRNIINSLQANKNQAAEGNNHKQESNDSITSDIQQSNEGSVSPLNLTKPRDTDIPRPMPPLEKPRLKTGPGFLCKDCGISLESQDAYAMHVMIHARGVPVTRANHTVKSPSVPNGTISTHPNMGFRLQMPMVSPQNRPYSAPVNEAMKARGQRTALTPATCAVNSEYSAQESDKVEREPGEIVKEITPDIKENGDGDSLQDFSNAMLRLRNKRSASADDAGEIKRSKISNWESTYSCVHCQKQFTDIAELTSHKRTCLSTVCTLCNLVFVDNFGLRVHQRSKAHIEQQQLKSLICHMCGWFASKPQEYVDHMKQHLPDLDEVIPNGTTETAEETILPHSACDATESNHTVSASNDITDMSLTSRRSKRKQRAAAKCIPTSQSSDFDEVWSESSGCDTPMLTPNYLNDRSLTLSIGSNPGHHQHMGSNHTPSAYTPRPITRSSASDTDRSTPVTTSTRPTTTSGHLLDDSEEIDVVDYVLSSAQRLAMCKYCKIVYLDKTMYYLHMGLHNLNNPWQCNLCGKVCRDVHEFSSHVIHY